MTNGTIYYYQVSAVNGSGDQSARSGEVSAIPVPTLAVPTGLVATDTTGPVNLTWNVTAGAAEYYVYRGTSSGGEVLLEVVSSNSFTDNGIARTGGHTYYYQVSAYNGVQTARSGEVSVVTPNIPAPTTPTNVVATAGNRQVTLTWAASAGATSYQLFRGTSSGGETLVAFGISGTSFTDTGLDDNVVSGPALTNGTTYYYEVVAINYDGGSPRSIEVSATPAATASAAPAAALPASASDTQVALFLTGKPTTGPTVADGAAATGTTANLTVAGSDPAGARPGPTERIRYRCQVENPACRQHTTLPCWMFSLTQTRGTTWPIT